MAVNPRIKLPESAKAGEIIEVKTLVTHVMETGNRHDKEGDIIPRSIIHTFVATFAGQEIFRANFGPGIAANPFLAFSMRVTGPGELQVTWSEDGGVITTERATLNVVS